MKWVLRKKGFLAALVIEAAFLVAYQFLQIHFFYVFSTVMAFPLEQIAWVLRKMSLSGAVGNAVSIILYLAIGLCPCAVYMLLRKKGKSCGTDKLLFVLSALLFAVLYYLINPGLLAENVSGGKQVFLGGTFYSVLAGYLVLRMLRSFPVADSEKLKRWLRILACAVAAVLVYMVFGACLAEMLTSVRNAEQTNTMTGVGGLTYLFFILRFLVTAIPYIMDILIVLAGIGVLENLMENAYSEEAVAAVEELGNMCVKALEAAAALSVLFHILQFLFHRSLVQIEVTVTIPVFSIAFILAVLLMARYVRENQRLKCENEMFI